MISKCNVIVGYGLLSASHRNFLLVKCTHQELIVDHLQHPASFPHRKSSPFCSASDYRAPPKLESVTSRSTTYWIGSPKLAHSVILICTAFLFLTILRKGHQILPLIIPKLFIYTSLYLWYRAWPGYPPHLNCVSPKLDGLLYNMLPFCGNSRRNLLLCACSPISIAWNQLHLEHRSVFTQILIDNRPESHVVHRRNRVHRPLQYKWGAYMNTEEKAKSLDTSTTSPCSSFLAASMEQAVDNSNLLEDAFVFFRVY